MGFDKQPFHISLHVYVLVQWFIASLPLVPCIVYISYIR